MPSSGEPPQSEAKTDQHRTGQDRSTRTRALALWLAFLGLTVLMGPIYLTGTYAKKETTRLASTIQEVEATLTAIAQPDATTQALHQALNESVISAEQMEMVAQQLQEGDIDWADVMSILSNYDPRRLVLTSLSQEGNRITLVGLATDEEAVVGYVRNLEKSALFSQVTLQSMKATERADAPFTSGATRQPAGTTREPTGTAATPSIVPSATPSPTVAPTTGDKFEPDQGQSPIVLPGQPQQHTFDPDGDRDYVRFVAKQGRSYRILTSDLAYGVDTSLLVHLDGWVYANDDEQPGMLSSSLVIHAPSGNDQEALIEISNRGVYGPEQFYIISVEEVLVTPTPSSTPTVPPTPSPTPTFDLRDGHEPDEATPAFIQPGESQSRSFYPEGDVDRATFTAQGQRAYRVYTYGLAPDVDTFLCVRVGPDVYVHDSVGEDDASSEVHFQVTGHDDVSVIVEVSNRGRYGPAQWYHIGVEEVAPAPTHTPTPTAPFSLGTPEAVSLITPSGTPATLQQQSTDGKRIAPVTISESVPRRALGAVVARPEGEWSSRVDRGRQFAVTLPQSAAREGLSDSPTASTVVEFAILLEVEAQP